MADSEDKKRDVPFIEKLIAALGLLLVLAVACSLGYEAFTGGNGPPDIDVQVNDVQQVRAGYLVRFKATNAGGSTGAQVGIRGQLKEGDRVIEESLTMLSFVPDGGSQEGGLFFERDPQRYRLQLQATGYEQP